MVEYSLVVASIFSFRTMDNGNTEIIILRLHFVLVVTRDGHGIPKSSPCPSCFF